MKKWIRLLKFYLLMMVLATTSFLAGCTVEEQEVMPQQTCDTQATVRNLASCGLVLVLKNGQLLMPINATLLPMVNFNWQQYKINGFIVKEEQQVIIGYINRGPATNGCLADTRLAEITCIVGYQAQP